jgi:hypothetical protein
MVAESDEKIDKWDAHRCAKRLILAESDEKIDKWDAPHTPDITVDPGLDHQRQKAFEKICRRTAPSESTLINPVASGKRYKQHCEEQPHTTNISATLTRRMNKSVYSVRACPRGSLR